MRICQILYFLAAKVSDNKCLRDRLHLHGRMGRLYIVSLFPWFGRSSHGSLTGGCIIDLVRGMWATCLRGLRSKLTCKGICLIPGMLSARPVDMSSTTSSKEAGYFSEDCGSERCVSFMPFANSLEMDEDGVSCAKPSTRCSVWYTSFTRNFCASSFTTLWLALGTILMFSLWTCCSGIFFFAVSFQWVANFCEPISVGTYSLTVPD